MAGTKNILRRLGAIDDVAIDVAVAAALPTADSDSLRLATQFLIERGRPEGLVGVVLEFHRLPTDLQQVVVGLASELYRPLREAAALRTSYGPANVVTIVGQARAAKLAYLVAEQLRHNNADIRHQAAQCLLDLSHWVCGEADDQPGCDAVTAQYVISAIEDAVVGFDRHLQPGVLEAMALLLPRPLPKAMTALGRMPHAAIPAVRQLLKQPRTVAVARALIPLAELPTMHDSVAAGLSRAAADGFLADLLHHGHLLRLPAVLGTLRRVRQTDGLTPRTDVLPRLAPRATRVLPDWYQALPLEPPERLTHLARLLRCRDPMTRLITLRHLIDLAQGGEPDYAMANQVISACCADSEARIATLALRHLVRVRWPGLAQLMFKLINAPQPEMRELAKTFLAPLGFERLWQAWPKLDAPQRAAAARALAKIDPDFHRQLQHKLVHQERATRLQALAIVTTLAQGAQHLKTLVAMTQDPDEVIASAAVSALGTAPLPEAQTALEHALEHRDTRVRANAVEALQQIQSVDHVSKLVTMAANEAPRPRANAIAALMHMRTGDAVHALVGMLNDPRPSQRTSALWLVDHLGLIEVTRHVAEMAITDPDPNVQQRARSVVEHLIDSIGHRPLPDELAEAASVVATPTPTPTPTPQTGD